MAKIRHRTFEMFDFLQEASDALASKSARPVTYAADSALWGLRQLDVTIKPSGVVHATFKPPSGKSRPGNEAEWMSDFSNDLGELIKSLTSGARVMLDFEGVETFTPDAIARLGELQSKLKNKGSRIVLCNLEPEVRAMFFPHLSTNTPS